MAKILRELKYSEDDICDFIRIEAVHAIAR